MEYCFLTSFAWTLTKKWPLTTTSNDLIYFLAIVILNNNTPITTHPRIEDLSDFYP